MGHSDIDLMCMSSPCYRLKKYSGGLGGGWGGAGPRLGWVVGGLAAKPGSARVVGLRTRVCTECHGVRALSCTFIWHGTAYAQMYSIVSAAHWSIEHRSRVTCHMSSSVGVQEGVCAWLRMWRARAVVHLSCVVYDSLTTARTIEMRRLNQFRN